MISKFLMMAVLEAEIFMIKNNYRNYQGFGSFLEQISKRVPLTKSRKSRELVVCGKKSRHFLKELTVKLLVDQAARQRWQALPPFDDAEYPGMV